MIQISVLQILPPFLCKPQKVDKIQWWGEGGRSCEAVQNKSEARAEEMAQPYLFLQRTGVWFPHPHDCSQPSVPPVPGSLARSSVIHKITCKHVEHRHPGMNTRLHRK